MKVTLFADMKSESWDSMNRYAQSLSREFNALNLSVSIFRTEPPLRSSRLKIFWRQKVYPMLARFRQGEVNHVLDHSYAHLLGFLSASRTVVTCHDLIPLEFERDERLLAFFKRTVSNLSKAAMVIADSEATRKDLISKLGLSPEKVKVIYLGVDPNFKIELSVAKDRLRRELNIPKAKIIFSHSSALNYKNNEGVLKAFRLVLNEVSDVYLLRVGLYNKHQRQLIKDLGIGDRILELARPTDEKLSTLYNLSDVFVSPSFKEGFGLTVLQALACGVPVVVSSGTSLEEVAGEFGVYCDPHDEDDIASKIISLLERDYHKDRAYQETLTTRARFFTWQKTARETLKVYQEVMPNRPEQSHNRDR